MPVADDTDKLLDRASQGDDSAVGKLMKRHRERLRLMVIVRLDPRLAARIDPSDVVQDSLLKASNRLSDYLQTRPMPFYPWLRQIAWEQLLDLNTHHIRTEKRSVEREAAERMALSDRSLGRLVDHLAASGMEPHRQIVRREVRQRVRDALDSLNPADREVLVMRFLEQLNTREIAAVLNVSEGAVRMRQLRSLERIRAILDDEFGEEAT